MINTPFNRRQLLHNCGAGFGSLALNELLMRTASADQSGVAAPN